MTAWSSHAIIAKIEIVELMTIKKLAIQKAKQSMCRFKVSAIGQNKRGECIGSAFNTPRLKKFGGGNHAEMNLLRRYGKQLKTIILCRVSKAGTILPIDPCSSCDKVLTSMKIKVVNIQ